MRRRDEPAEEMPASLKVFDPDEWADRRAWRHARLDWLKAGDRPVLEEFRAGLEERRR